MAKAKDVFDEESKWSEFTVTIPREKSFNLNLNLLNCLFEHF